MLESTKTMLIIAMSVVILFPFVFYLEIKLITMFFKRATNAAKCFKLPATELEKELSLVLSYFIGINVPIRLVINKTGRVFGLYDCVNKGIIIYIGHQIYPSVVDTLLHEGRHAWQDYNNMYKRTVKKGLTQLLGTVVMYNAYTELPEEVDARNYAKTYRSSAICLLEDMGTEHILRKHIANINKEA